MFFLLPFSFKPFTFSFKQKHETIIINQLFCTKLQIGCSAHKSKPIYYIGLLLCALQPIKHTPRQIREADNEFELTDKIYCGGHVEKARRRRWRSKRKGWHAEDLSGKRRSRDGVRRCCAGEEDWEEEVDERKGVGYRWKG